MTQSPNILFITDDQHRYDWLEMAGGPVQTPALMQLAREGVWHRNAFSVCPLCMPARCSFHTGLYAHQHGVTRNFRNWPLGLPTFPQVLQQKGYHTAAIGKVHVYEAVPEKLDLSTVRTQVMSLGYDELIEVAGKQMPYSGVDCDWSHDMASRGLLETYRENRQEPLPFPLPEELFHDTWTGDRCVKWLRDCPTDRPFYLWAGFSSPHPPYQAPASALARHSSSGQPFCIDNDTPGDWPQRRAHYSAMVEEIDKQVGRLLTVLEERGLLDDTLVIFTSDHGEMLGDHELAGKCYSYDPAVRVPLLVRFPSCIPAGMVCDTLVEITDLPATCLDIGIGCRNVTEHLPGSPGRSLATLWRGENSWVRDFAYSEDGGHFNRAFQMIRTERWKYTCYTEPTPINRQSCIREDAQSRANGCKEPEETLFDMINDPDECRNVADDPDNKPILNELRLHLLQHLANTPTPIRD